MRRASVGVRSTSQSVSSARELAARLGTRQAPLPIRVGEIEPVCARKDKEPQAAQKRRSDGHCRGATSLEAEALLGGDEAGGLHEELVAALLIT